MDKSLKKCIRLLRSRFAWYRFDFYRHLTLPGSNLVKHQVSADVILGPDYIIPGSNLVKHQVLILSD